jgi:aspartate-semialdehyde dehydrogenase
MLKVALVGWRGLVGSVLLERMTEENDFKKAQFTFFSCSAAGKKAPTLLSVEPHTLRDAFSLEDLFSQDIVISCQGSDYTKEVHGSLREKGWMGYWLDAASYLRAEAHSTLVLDPVNKAAILEALNSGKKDFIGANCTVSLMLLALQGLFEEDLIEWIHTSSYQAVSGAGSEAIQNLLEDLEVLGKSSSPKKSSGRNLLLDKMDEAHHLLKEKSLQTNEPRLGVNIFPWIDSSVGEGQTREEAKGALETNKILGTKTPIPLDGTCVRVPVLRCHSQTLTLSLKKTIALSELEKKIKEGNPWVELIPSNKEETIRRLTPAEASSTLKILVGRVRRLNLPGNLFEVFTVGDQLLWGAAEPLRRAFHLIVDFLEKNK